MNTGERELLFSVTASDCDFNYIRGSGKGGQKRNKTSSAVRCTHKASGAVGYSEDTRSQPQNKKIAFRRMTETKEFKYWHRLEIARRTGKLLEAKEETDRLMQDRLIKTEVFRGGGWREWEDEGEMT